MRTMHNGCMDTKAAETTVPKARLVNLATIDLIRQYERAISSYVGRFTNCSPRQKRIDYIVDLIDARADEGDDVALRWLEDAR